ncbi:hypothetical protein AB851_04615 [Ralstonia pseudosolanacearum]|nr:hypothetical protein AB851_04615 [Ralstonia pseudosolanacearum]
MQGHEIESRIASVFGNDQQRHDRPVHVQNAELSQLWIHVLCAQSLQFSQCAAEESRDLSPQPAHGCLLASRCTRGLGPCGCCGTSTP